MTTFSVAALSAVDDAGVSPGVLGFVVVALLGVATWLLIRSMTRQLKRIDIPEGGTPTRQPDGGAPDDGGEGGDEQPPAGSAQG